MTISKLSGSFSRGPPPPGVLQAMQRVHTPLNTKVYLEVRLRPVCPLHECPKLVQLMLLLDREDRR